MAKTFCDINRILACILSRYQGDKELTEMYSDLQGRLCGILGEIIEQFGTPVSYIMREWGAEMLDKASCYNTALEDRARGILHDLNTLLNDGCGLEADLDSGDRTYVNLLLEIGCNSCVLNVSDVLDELKRLLPELEKKYYPSPPEEATIPTTYAGPPDLDT